MPDCRHSRQALWGPGGPFLAGEGRGRLHLGESHTTGQHKDSAGAPRAPTLGPRGSPFWLQSAPPSGLLEVSLWSVRSVASLGLMAPRSQQCGGTQPAAGRCPGKLLLSL